MTDLEKEAGLRDAYAKVLSKVQPRISGDTVFGATGQALGAAGKKIAPYISPPPSGELSGNILRVASRPFIGKDRSVAFGKKVREGLVKKINDPLERGMHRIGVGKALTKFYEHGMRPIPGTPKLLHPILPEAAQRRAYGQWKSDDFIHAMAQNPELLPMQSPVLPNGSLSPPGLTAYYMGGKNLLNRALSKLAVQASSFADEIEKIAQVAPYQQETQWTCSAACLRSVLLHYGEDHPENEIVDLIGAKEGRGAEANEIMWAAHGLGFDAFEYSFNSIDQASFLLDQDIPIICDIQSFNHPGKGHYVVMLSADMANVILMDPNTEGNQRSIPREEMEDRWWDRAMAPPHELMSKWGVIVLPKEES